MLSKDFENFDLRLKTLREEQRGSFEVAENVFQESFGKKLEDIFPRDILGAKRLIAGSFIILYVDNLQPLSFFGKGKNGDRNKSSDLQPHFSGKEKIEGVNNSTSGIGEIFQNSVSKVIATLPLSSDKKKTLIDNIVKTSGNSETLEKYFRRTDDLSRDPFFALVEDFSIDGEISREEFLLLSESYGKSGNFFTALEGLPEPLRKLFESHVGNVLGKNWSERKHEFESEYSSELDILQKRGLNIEPVARFISRSYYKTPGKLRKYEDPRRRLRRTMKMSLLRLLRLKLGNVNAEEILRKFESGESFEDFFMLLYKLLEVVNEDIEGDEIYSLLDTQEETEELVVTAEETKKKILEGEELTASISSLLGDTDGKLEGEMFEKILDDDTHFHGDEVQFAHGEKDMAGIYAENNSDDGDDDEEQEDDLIDVGDTLEGNYESLKIKFQDLDEKKRKAFGLGEYDLIDEYNEELMRIESKIIKLAKLLGEE